jgi:hypothetical protein
MRKLLSVVGTVLLGMLVCAVSTAVVVPSIVGAIWFLFFWRGSEGLGIVLLTVIFGFLFGMLGASLKEKFGWNW